VRLGLGAIACIACYQPLEYSSQPAAPDAAPPASPIEVAFAKSHNDAEMELTYQLEVPPGADLLLVTVQVGEPCSTTAPMTHSVTYANTALTMVTGTQGGSCSQNSSELWQAPHPEVGLDEVVVVLDESAQSMQSGAIAFSSATALGTPMAIARSSMTTAEVTVPSEPGDLVASFISQGSQDGVAQGSAVTMVNGQIASVPTTLEYSAASMEPAAPGSATTMEWAFGDFADNWLLIAVAIKP
jgi:hypothetical protein